MIRNLPNRTGVVPPLADTVPRRYGIAGLEVAFDLAGALHGSDCSMKPIARSGSLW